MKNFLRRNKRLIAFVVALSFVFTTVIPENYSMVFASEISEDATSGDAIEMASSEDATINSEADVEGEAEAEEVEEDDGIRTLYADLRESGCSITVNATSESLPYPNDELSLSVRELEEGSIEYYAYLSDAAKELGEENTDDISFARFFDIEILYNGEKVEPESPVEVKIDYDEAPEIPDGAEMNIVHFGDEGTEVINDVQLSKDASEISYDQGSFSVTATIISGNPTTPDDDKSANYVLVAEYNGTYYTVQNNGSLNKIPSSSVDASDPNNVKITEETSFVWNYYSKDSKTYIRYTADGFQYDTHTQLATIYAYTFIAPNDDSGIISSIPEHEDDDNKTVKRDAQENIIYKNDITPDSSPIVFDNNEIKSAEGKYLTIDTTNNCIKGNANSPGGVKFYFAKSAVPSDDMPNNHIVNHIDISIEKTISAKIPLAYGQYYDENGNVVLTIDRQTYPTGYDLEVEQEVEVSQDSLRKAKITANKKKADETAGDEVDDAFYITGYTANAETGDSPPQVRIEGAFKVSYDMSKSGEWYINSDTNIWRERKEKIILYTVETVEPNVKFYYTNPNDPTKYLYDSEGRALYTESDVNVKASFDYFDQNNKCPAILNSDFWPGDQQGNKENIKESWQNGRIHPYGISGMDFNLSGDVTINIKPYAIEIENKIIDSSGNEIIPRDKITGFAYGIYADTSGNPDSVIGKNVDGYNGFSPDLSSYSHIHDKTIDIDNTTKANGTGVVYDYDLPEGMIYIEEDKSTVPDKIIDVNGDIWVYKDTYIETEYVWRNGDPDNYKRHYSDTYDKNDGHFDSVPEVIGTYGTDFNKFLEFYVRNVYEKVDPPTKVEMDPYYGSGILDGVYSGKAITYSISYKNYNTTASTIYIEDKLDENVSFYNANRGGSNENGIVKWKLENVPAGEKGSVELIVIVKDSAKVSNGGPGKVVNGGSTTTVRVDDDPAQSTNTVENRVVESPVKKEISPYNGTGFLGGVNVDEEITYEISYTNYKTSAAKVHIVDYLDEYVSYVSSSPVGNYDSRMHVVRWTINNVPGNTSGKVSLTVKVKKTALQSENGPGFVVNGDGAYSFGRSSAYVQVDNDNIYELDEVINQVPKTTEKTEISPYQGKGELGAVEVGDEITYRIDYENYQTYACDIKISDKLDDNVEYVKASCDSGDTVAYDASTHTVNWSLKDKDPDYKGYVTLTVKVLKGACRANGGPGEVINGGMTATVQVGNDNAYSLDEVKNPVNDPKTPDKPEDPKDPEKSGGGDSSSSTPKDPEKKDTKVTPPDASGSANSTPSKSTVKTGDTVPFIPVIIVMILSGVCIAALFIIKRRKKRQA